MQLCEALLLGGGSLVTCTILHDDTKPIKVSKMKIILATRHSDDEISNKALQLGVIQQCQLLQRLPETEDQHVMNTVMAQKL